VVVTAIAAQTSVAQVSFFTDSLQQRVYRASHDTARIAALCQLSEAFVLVESDSQRGRIEALRALRLADTLVHVQRVASAASYYRALALQALGVTYRFPDDTTRPQADSYFRQALAEASAVSDAKRRKSLQVSIYSAWLTNLRFRIQSHLGTDKSIDALRQDAEELLQQQQRIAQEEQHTALRAWGVLYRAIALTDSAVSRVMLTKESVRLYEQTADAQGTAIALSYLGYFASNISDYHRSLAAYNQAAHIADSVNALRGRGVIHQAIGEIYLRLGDTGRATASFRRAEPYIERYDVKFNRAEFCVLMGKLYHGIGNNDSARLYCQKAVSLSKSLPANVHTSLRLGSVFYLQRDIPAAMQAFRQAGQFAERLTEKRWLSRAYYEIALLYKHQADNVLEKSHSRQMQSSIDSAIRYATYSLTILTNKTGIPATPTEFFDLYILLYHLHRKANSAQALYYIEQAVRWKDSVLKREALRDIAALESRAVIHEMEAKMETFKVKERLQHTIILSLAGAAFASAAIVVLLIRQSVERKKVAARLQVQNEQLAELNKEKDELMGIVAHDLKNPLSNILGRADMLLNYSSEFTKEETITFLRSIMNSSEQMVNLVKNVLEMNRLETQGLQVYCVPTCVSTMAKFVVQDYQRRAAEKHLHLQYDADNSTMLVQADESLLRQVLDNLVSNAVKYSPHDKTVFVRVKSSPEGVRVEVQDEGPGISAEDMKKLFGKFARLTARPTGGEHSTGLGLSIVKKLVEAMQGRVWCESEVGDGLPTGATFIVELPNMNKSIDKSIHNTI
jgi:signal transduction histidine kinase